MEEEKGLLVNDCELAGVKPVMMALPYPPVRVREKNVGYANLLSADYCGAVSEMSAIMQYVNQENRLSCERCPIIKVILGISMAEMIHLQKLGELIYLLGGTIDFTTKQRDGRQRLWTPEYLTLPQNVRKMLLVDIESEKAAIQQYRMHIKMMDDKDVNAVLARIIKDEEYHIMVLQALLEKL